MFSFFSQGTDPKKLLKNALGDFQLPSFPDVVLKTLEIIRDPNADAHAISDVLAKDPGLTVKVLKTVNSAAFSPAQRVENLQQAIALIGMSSLESLVLSMGITKTLPNEAVGGFNPQLFWLGCARRAYVAKGLSKQMHPQKNMDCFTAGLLQDMAVPLLVNKKPQDYEAILSGWEGGEKRLHELEREKFGFDHAEVATWICAEWDLPESLASAIGGHNQKEEEGTYERPGAVYLVSLIRNNKDNPGTDQLIEEANKDHGLEKELVQQIIDESFKEAEELVNIISKE